MSHRYDPPEVYHEEDLKRYGRKIAAQVESGTEKELKPNFEELRELTLSSKQELALRMLGIPTRTLNALETKGIITVGQLVRCPYRDIMAIANCGPKTVIDCYDALAELRLVDLWDVLPADLNLLFRKIGRVK